MNGLLVVATGAEEFQVVIGGEIIDEAGVNGSSRANVARAIGKRGGRGEVRGATIEHGFFCVVTNSGRGHDGRFDGGGAPLRVESSKKANKTRDMGARHGGP